MAGTERLLEAIDKMTLALQELREAVLELTAEEAAPAPEAVCEPIPEAKTEASAEPKPIPEPEAPAAEPVPVWQPEPESAPVVVNEPEPVVASEPAPEPVLVFAPAPEPAQAEKRCPVCGEPVKAGDRFCMNCGATIPEDAAPAQAPAQRVFCMNCGNPLNPGDKFCMKCGQRTDA